MIEKGVRQGRGELLLLRYHRGPHVGVLALRVSGRGPLEIKALTAADASEATLQLRAGVDAFHLNQKSVAIIGLGAVGSFLADLFVRGGIGQLSLWDGERLRPGNSVRHLLGSEYWGWNKAAAVRDFVIRAGWIQPDVVAIEDRPLWVPARTERLLQEHDLVVDATASGPTTSMLADLAQEFERPLLSVCIQREGDVVRVDRWPLKKGEVHGPPVAQVDEPADLRESGCGDPVSPAPPAAAVEAASLAWRMAADLLTGRGRFPPSIVHLSTPGTEAPYDRVGTLA